MAILGEAQFTYVVRLRRGSDGFWRGQATAPPDQPHLVGATPGVELVNGVLSLIAGSKSNEPRPHPWLPETYPMASRALMDVGDILDAVLQDDDEIHLRRDAMAAVGLIVSRGDHLVLGLGNVTGSIGRFGITVAVDPRADDVRFYYMKRLLDEPDCALIWLDPASPAYESQLAEFDHMPAHVTMLSIVARCSDSKVSSEVNALAVARHRCSSFNYETVSPRFETREAFIDHLRSLPSSRPKDFFLSFTVDGHETVVREHETREAGAWLIHVNEVASPMEAWSRSAIGIARAHPGLSADALRTSVKQIAHLHMEIWKR